MYLSNIGLNGVWYNSIFSFLIVVASIVLYDFIMNGQKIIIGQKINAKFIKIVRIIIWLMLIYYIIQKNNLHIFVIKETVNVARLK